MRRAQAAPRLSGLSHFRGIRLRPDLLHPRGMPLSDVVVLSLAGLPLGYLLAQRWATLWRETAERSAAAPTQANAEASRGGLTVRELRASSPDVEVGADGPVPLPSEYLARWTIDYDAGGAQLSTRTVRVLRVHPRLMGLMCYCEDTHHIRNFAWQGLRSVRDPESGQPVDFSAWVNAAADAA